MPPLRGFGAAIAILTAVTGGALLCRGAALGRRAKSLGEEPIEGEIGVAASELNPAGEVRVRGAIHRAASQSRVPAGARIVVVEGGAQLLVKPL